MFNLETKYRFLTDPKLHTLPRVLGIVFTVQYRKWYSPFWITIGQAKNAEEINQHAQEPSNLPMKFCKDCKYFESSRNLDPTCTKHTYDAVTGNVIKRGYRGSSR